VTSFWPRVRPARSTPDPGSGNLKAADFKAKNVSVAIEGSGDADIRVAGGASSMSVNGSGDIRWTRRVRAR
jgi:hypothetical protein